MSNEIKIVPLIYEVVLIGEWHKFSWRKNYLLKQEDFECFIINHAINTSSYVTINHSIFDMWKYLISTNCINDLEKLKKFLEKYEYKGDKNENSHNNSNT